jgi:hypothetical protein
LYSSLKEIMGYVDKDLTVSLIVSAKEVGVLGIWMVMIQLLSNHDLWDLPLAWALWGHQHFQLSHAGVPAGSVQDAVPDAASNTHEEQ